MGTAFAAIADDPSAIFHNPAGLTNFKGTNIYGGVTAIIPYTKYESPSGESEETDFQVFFPPHSFASTDFGMDNKALGLGLFSPFGIGGRKWSDSGPTRYVSTETAITTVAVNPAFAWQVIPSLSIGLGVYYLHSFNNVERMVDQSMFGAEDAEFTLDADGGGFGFNAGVIIFPKKMFSFGIAYRSGVEVDQDGTAKLKNIAPELQPLFGGSKFKTDVDTTVDFPQDLTLGLAFRPTKKLTFGLDLEWGGWSSFDSQEFDFDTEIPGTGISDGSIDLDWDDAWSAKVGVEYLINERVALRTGYAYVQSPVPESDVSPINPDSDQHNFSIGFGYKIKSWIIDGFYNAGFFEDRKVDNNILDGEYENFVNYFGFSIGYGF
jgi:long-chain fatty acid transport protein